MLNSNLPQLLVFKKTILLTDYKKIFNFFNIQVNGRIFKFEKKKKYSFFKLPVTNKPYLFFNKNYCIKKNLTLKYYIVINTEYNYNLVKTLLKIKKPSIFNSRGFFIYNKVNYKKKGKISSYVTNK